MEKSGEKAGERAGKAASKKMNEELRKGSGQFERDFRQNIDGINKALNGIETKKLSNNLRKELAEVKRELSSLKDIDLTVDVDKRAADEKIAVLEGRVRGLRDDVKIVFRTDIDKALKGFSTIQTLKESIEDPIDIEVRTEKAERQMTSFEKSFKKIAEKAAGHLSGSMNSEVRKIKAELDSLRDLRIGVDIDANEAMTQMRTLMRRLDIISSKSPDIDVKVDTGRAFAELAALDIALKKLDATSARTSRGLFGLKRTGEDVSNSFRSFSTVILAAAGAGPALIPILAAIAGGLIALGPAAAIGIAALGSVLVGFSGIGNALGALQAQQDQMAMTTQTAARSEASAARAVAKARQSAAKAVESALKRQREAQERYGKSLQDVRDAEMALRQAREAAKDTGKNIDRDIRSNQLAIDEAMLGSFNATVNFNAVSSDGSATNAEQEQARIDMEQAKIVLEELRLEQEELAQQKAKWDKEGVNGTDEVKSAQEELNDALEAQKDAYEDLRESAQAVDQARKEGAEQVSDALAAQADALAGVNAQQNKVNQAFAALGPAGQAFSLYLFGLRKQFQDFRNDIQTVMLPAIQQAMEGFFASANAKTARKGLVALAAGFGEFVKVLSTSFQGPAWAGFFEMMATTGPKIQAAFGGAFIGIMEAFASIMTTAAPFALRFAEGLEKMMLALADWAASEKGQAAITRFLDYVEKVAPAVLDFFGAAARGIANIAEALAPWGEIVLDGITQFFDFIANMDPEILGAVGAGLASMLVAFQVATGIQALGASLAAVFSGVLGPIVFLIVGVALALVYLYKTNKEFRDFVNKAWASISKAVMKAWNEYLKPAIMDFWDALQQLWVEVLQPFFAWLGPIIVKFLEFYLPAMMRVWSAVFRTIAWIIREVVIPVFKAMAEYWKWAWENVWKPILKNVGDRFEQVFTRMKWVWTNVLKPVFDFITDTALPKLKSGFQTAVDGIARIWSGLRKIVAAPIKFVLKTVLNDGLIAGFDKVASFVKLPGIGKIDIPEGINNAYATGGILPGYTPGRDVHEFYSASAGRLSLSGGEAIMRPEWTAAVGSGFVNFMNGAAQNGGVRGVRKALAAYFGGDAGVTGSGQANAFATGGVLSLDQITRAQKFVRDHDYASYQMGAVGPNQFDCSGLIAAATNVIRGVGNVYQRLGATSTFPWSGFKQGVGQFTVGSTPNYGGTGIGHMAGTLGGINIESRGGDGVVYGSRARGYNDPGFIQHYYLGAGLGASVPGGGKVAKGGGISFPNWLINVGRNPLGYVKGLVQGPIDNMKQRFGSSDFVKTLAKAPMSIANGVADKIFSMLPGPVKSVGKGVGRAVSAVGDATSSVIETGGDVIGGVGDALGFKNGGILPYNGTMMYDDGGYLPPGLTSVVNLTGKPEPVFTSDQWSGMEGGAAAGTIHYEPHFEGSDLTAADVAGDLNFAFRKMRRGGKYERVGNQ